MDIYELYSMLCKKITQSAGGVTGVSLGADGASIDFTLASGKVDNVKIPQELTQAQKDIIAKFSVNASGKLLFDGKEITTKTEVDTKLANKADKTDLAKKTNIADIIDNLTSSDSNKPLSANQGKTLKDELDKKANTTDMNTELAKKINTADIVDNLTSTDTNKPLSANQGKVLKAKVDKKINITDIVDNLTSTNTDKPLSANQGKVISGKLNKKVNITDIVDNLTSTDINKPLSANQGKVLKDEIDKKANNSDLTNHTSDKNIHITTAERTKWNGIDNKVNKTDLNNLSQGILVTETSPMNENILLWDVGHYYFSLNALWRTYKNIPSTEYSPHVYVTSVKPIRYNDINLNNAEKQTWFRQIKVDSHLGESFIRTIYTPDINDVINLENGKLLPSGSDTGWQRVCTTSVEDVPKTTITFSDTTIYEPQITNFHNHYEVVDGECYVSLYIKAIAPTNQWTLINASLPKPKRDEYKSLGVWDNGTGNVICTIDTVGRLQLRFGTVGTTYIGTFRYKVANPNPAT